MASLIRPLNRCISLSLRQSSLLSVAQQKRFKASDSTTPGSVGKLDKPLDKKAVDTTGDPKESYLIDPWEILYGAERFEVAMKSKGYDDPYDMEPAKRKPVSTKADPNIVQTLADHRVVGCVCAEDTHHINFMWIAKGETKRCECGHWFKCTERELPDLSEYGMKLEKHAH